MLFFRSEEHVTKWCKAWHFRRGGTLSLETGWKLAHAWYSADRRDKNWRRRTVDEAAALFAQLGLTTSFWSLR